MDSIAVRLLQKPSKHKGRQILSKTGGRLKLKQDVLDEILKPVENLPVAIISVCGDQRQGKSFLLNLLFRHLVKPDNSRVSENDEELATIFEWKAGMNRMTEGIWMLNTPIIIKRGTKEIALYLMDTQGMFDIQTSKKECAQIFSLATLMSSYLVFNLKEQIQSYDIDHLEFWTCTAKWAEEQGSAALFQNLLFLLRDFRWVEMGYGLQGGKEYLNEMFMESAKNDSEVNQSISNLKRVFEQVSACALPRPSDAVVTRKSNAETLVIGDIGADFLEYSHELFEHLAKNVKSLNLSGNETTGKELKEIISYSSKMLLGDEMPSPVSLSNDFVNFQLSRLSEKEAKKYEKNMQTCIEPCTSAEQLQGNHISYMNEALRNYDEAKKIGSKAVIEAKREKLQNEIKEMFVVILALFEFALEIKAYVDETTSENEERIQNLKRKICELEEIQKNKADKLCNIL